MSFVSGTYMIGYCYRNGLGVEKDEDKAFIYYQKSAEMVMLMECQKLVNVIEKELE
jgi:TPR repeat protein